jgi:hypothetical protein
MHYKINIKWMNNTKILNVPQLDNIDNLLSILKKLFKMNKKLDIIGVTDIHGKFYDLFFFSVNFKIFNEKIVNLVTTSVFDD